MKRMKNASPRRSTESFKILLQRKPQDRRGKEHEKTVKLNERRKIKCTIDDKEISCRPSTEINTDIKARTTLKAIQREIWVPSIRFEESPYANENKEEDILCRTSTEMNIGIKARAAEGSEQGEFWVSSVRVEEDPDPNDSLTVGVSSIRFESCEGDSEAALVCTEKVGEESDENGVDHTRLEIKVSPRGEGPKVIEETWPDINYELAQLYETVGSDVGYELVQLFETMEHADDYDLAQLFEATESGIDYGLAQLFETVNTYENNVENSLETTMSRDLNTTKDIESSGIDGYKLISKCGVTSIGNEFVEDCLGSQESDSPLAFDQEDEERTVMEVKFIADADSPENMSMRIMKMSRLEERLEAENPAVDVRRFEDKDLVGTPATENWVAGSGIVVETQDWNVDLSQRWE
ncbi:hypothetical protein CBR_g3262 [Chara braunii]|uniref:Uncharacterized protein n=1 Tax=Chara braunii TaxID=69332 RepID=A0A388KF91_CHABU|nr:hypothetical protein CBR_g3262 [Chara braunii]|eukprot:GBG68720.1 hypothetical protein CBR_g3262 [Chara braunii]